LAKTSQGWNKLGAKVSFGLQKTAVSKDVWAATGGTVNVPGTVDALSCQRSWNSSTSS
jgi:hypothetical protein